MEAKTLTQVANEAIRERLVAEIDRRISRKTKNVLRLWVRDTLGRAARAEDQNSQDARRRDGRAIESFVRWATETATKLSVGEDARYRPEGEVEARLTVIGTSDQGGYVGIQDVGGAWNGLFTPLDVGRIRSQVRERIKAANGTFKQVGEDAFTLLHVVARSGILLADEERMIPDVLYGRPVSVHSLMADGSGRERFERRRDGIWSREQLTHVDAIFWHRQGTDKLGNQWDPYVFVNPAKAGKLTSIPEPFASMKVLDPM